MPQSARAASAASPPNILSSDAAFDSVYDGRIRELSRQHWTPVPVALRAAQLLTRAGATRILDVGSGVGKFCIVGALSTSDAEFVGVERRGSLVEIARHAALKFGAGRARFVHADVESFPFEGFDGVYLYNPFYEQVGRDIVQIDAEVELSVLTYRRLVRSTLTKLGVMKPPVAVVTFNGVGAPLPPEYDLRGDEPAGTDYLELWVRRRSRGPRFA
jgi:SAM-dependent methyltransferase